MEITIHYRGTIADLDRVEEFEDRVVDMALEIGAAVWIWRRAANQDATRVVRGLIVDVSPGQETNSLLISPEGWLVPLHEIEAAETGLLAEPPDCRGNDAVRFGRRARRGGCIVLVSEAGVIS